MSVSNVAERLELKRVLGLWDSVGVIVGIIIGSGIFFTPTSIAKALPNEELILLVWAIGGISVIAGALTYAELSAAWPHTGGMYVFIRECFGTLPSFLFGWAQLTVIRPAGVAAVAVVFAQYVGYFTPLPPAGVRLMAVFCILLVSVVNYLGVRFTSLVQNVLTIIKVVSLLLISFFGLFFFKTKGMGAHWSTGVSVSGLSMLGNLGLAMVGVYWTYDGWSEITTVAGEVHDPSKLIPKALWIGTAGIIIIYLLVNAAFLQILSLEGVQSSSRVASDAVTLLMGPVGGSVISLVVLISTLGTLNGVTLTGPRIFFAMAVDGLFFTWARKVHPRFRTPSLAIVLQAVLSIPLVITWTFEQLTTYFIFSSLIFYGLTTLCVFKLRAMPNRDRNHYQTWGYPVTPILFLVVALGILLNTIWKSPVQAMVATGILLGGVPIYWIWKKKT